MWPIKGVTNDELWDSTNTFLGSMLGLEGKINKAAIECISRAEIPSGPGVSNEALVRFKDVDVVVIW